MQTEKEPAPAKENRPPEHLDAETQRPSQDTTGLDVAAPLVAPPALSGTRAGTTGVSLDDYPPILTTKHLCEALHVSYNTLTAELQHGSLAPIAVRVGRQYRVSREALRRYIEGGAS